MKDMKVNKVWERQVFWGLGPAWAAWSFGHSLVQHSKPCSRLDSLKCCTQRSCFFHLVTLPPLLLRRLV
jgi:hypothetical protein